MSRLWRSCPPVFLILWLSKWLSRVFRGITITEAEWKRGIVHIRGPGRSIEAPPKPLKGKSKKSKPAPKVEVRVSSKHRNTDLGKALEAWARGDLDFIETSQERKPFKEEK